MALYEVAVVREQVISWRERLSGDVSFTAHAVKDMQQEELDLSDVISALETSDTTTVAKENSHDAFFSLVGTTCDADAVRVTVSINPCSEGVCVHHVQRH
jgi:hypothetical protein